MASNIKKYILTAVTLGLVAASGAFLISGTNMLTKDKIAENEQKSIYNGIHDIYGIKNFNIYKTEAINDSNYKYVNTRYIIKSTGEEPYGYVFRTDGSNNYGKISLIIGFNKDCVYEGLSVIANEQSFASTLKKGYIDKIKDVKGLNIEDVNVSCGATYGAKLVRAMVEEATKAATKLLGEQNG